MQMGCAGRMQTGTLIQAGHTHRTRTCRMRAGCSKFAGTLRQNSRTGRTHTYRTRAPTSAAAGSKNSRGSFPFELSHRAHHQGWYPMTLNFGFVLFRSLQTMGCWVFIMCKASALPPVFPPRCSLEWKVLEGSPPPLRPPLHFIPETSTSVYCEGWWALKCPFSVRLWGLLFPDLSITNPLTLNQTILRILVPLDSSCFLHPPSLCPA